MAQLAAQMSGYICKCYITQSFIRTRDKLSRDIFLKHPNDLCLGPNQYLNLLRLLYVLSNSGENWFVTLPANLRDDLHMDQTDIDQFLFLKMHNGILQGPICTNVYETIQTADAEFLKLTELTHNSFETKPMTTNSFTYTGVDLSVKPYPVINNQPRAAKRL